MLPVSLPARVPSVALIEVHATGELVEQPRYHGLMGSEVTALEAMLGYCFLLGLLHGIVPDEHTWPITFSYAIGSGSSAEGMRTGIYFAAAFTLQRTLLSDIARGQLRGLRHQ